jgi:hypothetical protein
MDARDEWRKLEPRLDDIERAASELSESTRRALSEAIARLTDHRRSPSEGCPGREAGRAPPDGDGCPAAVVAG